MPQIELYKQGFHVAEGEFSIIDKNILPAECAKLNIMDNLALYEQMVGFLKLLLRQGAINNVVFVNPTHGGYLPLFLLVESLCETMHIFTYFDQKASFDQINAWESNIEAYSLTDYEDYITSFDELKPNMPYRIGIADAGCYVYNNYDEYISYCDKHINEQCCIFMDTNERNITTLGQHFQYVKQLFGGSAYICYKYEAWGQSYGLCESGAGATYNNLLDLTMIVANAGPQFEATLRHNLAYCDHWTILDTGSTDDTLEIIKRITTEMGKPPNSVWGTLLEEKIPLEDLHFARERNKVLNKADERGCAFTLMLDDSYKIVSGDRLRAFLQTIRGCQMLDSFSLFISSNGDCSPSNRILRTRRGLHYKYRVHEVPSPYNNNIVEIPKTIAYIDDPPIDYMYSRTMARKQLEIKWLLEECEKEPNDPRSYFYLARCYLMMEDYENALAYYMKRASFVYAGFYPEYYNSYYRAGFISHYNLKKPWPECEQLFIKATQIDPTRPEAYYELGVYYAAIQNWTQAYKYLFDGFKMCMAYGASINYEALPRLYFHVLPYQLARICYHVGQYAVGQTVCEFFLAHVPQIMGAGGPGINMIILREIESWYAIYKVINSAGGGVRDLCPKQVGGVGGSKPLVVFVADGGFKPWRGSSLIKEGLGGSETYIVEMAQAIQRLGVYQVYVFCNCGDCPELFEGVTYLPVRDYGKFVMSHYVTLAIISRFSEYIPISLLGWAESVYLVLHDIMPSGSIIPMHRKLKRVYCLSEWHKGVFLKQFPFLLPQTSVLYYGIDPSLFGCGGGVPVAPRTVVPKGLLMGGSSVVTKKPYSFIYSSYANRGLYPLLQMWPSIIKMQPRATLNIFCDLDNVWVNAHYGEMMRGIRELLENYKKSDPENEMGLYVYGWVNKATLAAAWKQAEYWFYPCIFEETFCLTALEAALSRCFVITNGLAALGETVGARGLILEGDPSSELWREHAIKSLVPYLVEPKRPTKRSREFAAAKEALIEENYKWACGLTWQGQAALLHEHIFGDSLWDYKENYVGIRGLDEKIFDDFMKVVLDACHKEDGLPLFEVNTYSGVGCFKMVEWFRLHCPKRVLDCYVLDNFRALEGRDILSSFNKHKDYFMDSSCNMTIYNGEICSSLMELVQTKAFRCDLFVYYCCNPMEIVAELNLLYNLVPGGGLLILNVGPVANMPMVKSFCDKYAMKILCKYDNNGSFDNAIFLMQKPKTTP